VAEALGILLGRDHGEAEAPGRRGEDLDVPHHLLAVIGIHGGKEALLHVHDHEGGPVAGKLSLNASLA
jgi:hypothetical protein